MIHLFTTHLFTRKRTFAELSSSRHLRVTRLISAVACLLLCMHTAQAITVKGGLSCEEWQETRTEAAAGRQAARLNEITAKYWVIGYLSALAGTQADNLRNDPLKVTSNEKIYGAIDLYCTSNPDKQLQDAIVALWLDIARFKKSRK